MMEENNEEKLEMIEPRDATKIVKNSKGNNFEFKMYRDKGETIESYLARVKAYYAMLHGEFGGQNE